MSEKHPPISKDAKDADSKTERESFYVCPECGERVDWRDPAQVMRHAAHVRPETPP